MKHINRLILKAKAFCEELFYGDGGFIEALGLDPKDFAIMRGNEIVGYDEMKALHAVSGEVWKK